MKQIRKRLTYANVMSSLAVFLILGGATAIAASQIGKKSVGSAQLKANAVTAKKIKKNAVTGKKIKNGAVDGSKVKDDSLTGADINESTLGTVPSANSANDLVGLARFNVKVPFGGTKTLFTAGPFSFTATCLQNATDFQGPTTNRDILRILISTNTNGMLFDAEGSKRGSEPTDFLNTNTPEEERVFVEESVPTGDIEYEAFPNETDGAAYQPNGIGVSFNTTGLGIGINNPAPGCFLHGFAVVENPS